MTKAIISAILFVILYRLVLTVLSGTLAYCVAIIEDKNRKGKK